METVKPSLSDDQLRFEVQMQDGTPQASFKALALVVDRLNDKSNFPVSLQYNFFEEFYKCFIDWMGKGEIEHIETLYSHIEGLIKTDHDFMSPFEGSTSKKRFGAYLNIIKQMAEVYLRSDFLNKDLRAFLSLSKLRRKQAEMLVKVTGTKYEFITRIGMGYSTVKWFVDKEYLIRRRDGTKMLYKASPKLIYFVGLLKGIKS